MADFRQHSTPGGHVLVMETEVMDGHLRLEEAWQHLTMDSADGEVVVGSTPILRTVWLNNCRVRDPELAEKLWHEALRQ
jgi:hypothetical protein